MTPRLQPRSARRKFLRALAAVRCCCRLPAGSQPPADRVRVSGQVEATEVQVAAQVGGRCSSCASPKGDRVEAGDRRRAARHARRRARAGARAGRARRRPTRSCGCCGPARAPKTSARRRRRSPRPRPTSRAADAELAAAQTPTSSASRRSRVQRRLAQAARRCGDAARRGARARARRARERVRAAARERSRGCGPARAARRSTPPARASPPPTRRSPRWQKSDRRCRPSSRRSPASSPQKLVDAGELVAPRAPLVVVTDLDHAWANVYVDEPLVPRLTLGQPATVFTDAGGSGSPGTVTFISPQAEFTPRNVQTAEERSKLVYRSRSRVDNTRRRAQAGHAGRSGDSAACQ